MVSKKTLLVFIVLRFSFLAYISGDDESNCPTSPCLDPKPQLTVNQPLEIGVLYNESKSDFIHELWESVCQLVNKCEGIIQMRLIPGAATEEKNGKMVCGSTCYDNEWQVCVGLLEPKYLTVCKYDPIPNEPTIEACINAGRASDTMIANGKLRKEKGIPTCKLPTLIFNGAYDSCVTQNNYDDLKKYVCGLYDNAIGCCQK